MLVKRILLVLGGVLLAVGASSSVALGQVDPSGDDRVSVVSEDVSSFDEDGLTGFVESAVGRLDQQ